jgi:hypothetical protein
MKHLQFTQRQMFLPILKKHFALQLIQNRHNTVYTQ